MKLNNNTLQLCLLFICCCLTTSRAYYQQSCAGKTLLRSGGLTCQDRQVILDAHNKKRQEVALGKVAGQPAATNMLEMVWDEELAAVAQRWADKCTLAHDGARERDVARFPVGQNIAVTWTTRTNAGAAPDFPRQVRSWFNEVRHYGFYSTGFTKATGHYSQLVWGDSYLVGCGYSHYYEPSRGYTKLYVCNYGPGGNIRGSLPYQVGNPSCSSKGLQSSSRYQGLCETTGYPVLGSSCSSNSIANYGSTSQTYSSSSQSSSSFSQTYSSPFQAYSSPPQRFSSSYQTHSYNSQPTYPSSQSYTTQSPVTRQTFSLALFKQRYYG